MHVCVKAICSLLGIVLVIFAASVGLYIQRTPHGWRNMNVHIMRLVRDVGRMKARSRRGMEIVPVFYGSDDDTTTKAVDDLTQNYRDFNIVTPAELAAANGRLTRSGDDGDREPVLWLCVLGHVFDVSAGHKFYAPGKDYHMLTGKDVTRILATGDLQATGGDGAHNDLSPYEQSEAKRWLEYFATHDKYTHVGRMKDSHDETVDIDTIVDYAINNEGQSARPTPTGPPKWHPPVMKGAQRGAMCAGGP